MNGINVSPPRILTRAPSNGQTTFTRAQLSSFPPPPRWLQCSAQALTALKRCWMYRTIGWESQLRRDGFLTSSHQRRSHQRETTGRTYESKSRDCIEPEKSLLRKGCRGPVVDCRLEAAKSTEGFCNPREQSVLCAQGQHCRSRSDAACHAYEPRPSFAFLRNTSAQIFFL